MPKTSRTTAPTVADHGPVVDRSADLEGYSVNFVSFAIDIDGAPLLKSLPDDRCACPLGLRVQGERLVHLRRPQKRPTRPATPTTCLRATRPPTRQTRRY